MKKVFDFFKRIPWDKAFWRRYFVILAAYVSLGIILIIAGFIMKLIN